MLAAVVLRHRDSDGDTGCMMLGPVDRQDADDPQHWSLDIPVDRIDLYLQLKDAPRALTAAEATMMVELVDAWRALEHRKHIALEHARQKNPSSS
jgi:hypothetical protein